MNRSVDAIDLYNNSSPPSPKKKIGKKITNKAEPVEWPEAVEEYQRPDQVNWEVDYTDPGSFFTLASDEDVHAAMYGDAPLPQGLHVGATPAESAANLKAW
jgi:hypothetical protein